MASLPFRTAFPFAGTVGNGAILTSTEQITEFPADSLCHGFKRHRDLSDTTGEFGRVDHPWTTAPALHYLAKFVLEAVDGGAPVGDLARDLAVGALRTAPVDSDPWLHAVAVLEGGPLRIRHAVELAAAVLTSGALPWESAEELPPEASVPTALRP